MLIIDRQSQTQLTTPHPVDSYSFILNIFVPRFSNGNQRRQSSGNYVGRGQATDSCANATLYTLVNGRLFANQSGGTSLQFGTSSGTQYATLVPSSSPGDIMTTFSVDNDNNLMWTNTAFYQQLCYVLRTARSVRTGCLCSDYSGAVRLSVRQAKYGANQHLCWSCLRLRAQWSWWSHRPNGDQWVDWRNWSAWRDRATGNTGDPRYVSPNLDDLRADERITPTRTSRTSRNPRHPGVSHNVKTRSFQRLTNLA